MQRRRIGAGLVCLDVGLLAVTPAWALITRLTPLGDLLEDSQMILTARVEALDPARPSVVLSVDESLKGKAPFARLAVNLTGDKEAAKEKHTPQLLRRLAPKLPVLLFVHQRDKEFTSFAYTNGTWFQLNGVEAGDGVRWSFTHCEPYLRKTFKGPTGDLKQVVADVLAGKQKPPEPDKKEKPGLGPEVEAEKKEEKPSGTDGKAPAASVTGGPPFAVIPAVLVGGPLALLAMLFPAVFGGLMLVLGRWMAGLSVLSLLSTLYLLHSYFAPSLAASWWGTPAALWLTMSGVTLLGMLWAWRRHLAESAFHTPGWVEMTALGAAGLGCAIAAFWLPRSVADMSVWDKTLVMMSVGLWVAVLHICYQRWIVARREPPRPGVPGEGLLLSAMLAVGLAFATTFQGESAGSGPGPSEGESPYRVVWRFRPPTEPCWMASSPLVDGDRVFIAAVHPSAFRPGGAVYCVDRASGRLLWTFNDGGRMKDAFSTPCVADGRLYLGEGFHQNQDCKLYCLDAASGKKLWEHQTGSHTESSPCVAGGKVYFGAGDDGLYCLDAASGKEKWHLNGLHVDANPVVVNGRVYAGSGYNGREEQAFKDTVAFCLDAETGKEYWRVPTEFSVWGQPVVDGGRVYLGIASGDFMEAGSTNGGGVLCLEADSGKRVWFADVKDGVLGRVAVDAKSVYFGSRDGNCYAVDRKDGKERWKEDMGSPVLASVSLLESGSGAESLYAASREGRLARLDPATGKVAWSFEVGEDAKQAPVLFSSPALVPVGGERRRIYFGCGLNNFKRGVLYCLEEKEAPAGP